MTDGLPDREGLGSGFNNKNNTVRIPAKILYNGEEFTVVAFATFKGNTNNTYKLDLSDIDNNLIQVLEFDIGLIEINGDLSINNDGDLIKYPTNPSVQQINLLSVINFPNIGMNLSGSTNLKEITFNSISAYGPSLNNCTSLTTLNLPAEFNNIRDCTSLKTVTIAEGAIEIFSSAFRGCSNLVSITLQNTLTRIYNNAFENCSSLESIIIPESVNVF